MYLKELKIKNFRNINSLNLELDKNINIFIGKNAQGKTSILESIYVLALSKSSRNIEDFDLIKMDSDFARITGTVSSANKKNDYFVILIVFLFKFSLPKNRF